MISVNHSLIVGEIKHFVVLKHVQSHSLAQEDEKRSVGSGSDDEDKDFGEILISYIKIVMIMFSRESPTMQRCSCG